MTSFRDLASFFKSQDFRVIIAADAETRISKRQDGKIVSKIPAGGVAIALDPIARASHATYIGRGKTEEEREIARGNGKIKIENANGAYTLKRLFFSEQDFDSYYNGFANQTLWPLCHVAFERPQFRSSWYEGFKKVNETFANAIREEIEKSRGKTLVWINDYHLCLVPKYLGKQENTIVSMFWHIPWPTWEVFRILPYKGEIVESLLTCNFLAFHRGYHVRNFLETAQREFAVRVDEETNKVYFNRNTTTVRNLPMGIDTDIVKSLLEKEGREGFLTRILTDVLGKTSKKADIISLFKQNKIILGIDRLDYTKGLLLRLNALDRFLEKYPKYIGKVVYLGIIAPSREGISAYQGLKREIAELAAMLNRKYQRRDWQPVYISYGVFPRRDIINFYKHASVCLVTPRDDGMNLVSKEFVLTSSFANNPGMLVLSQFAGSSIDLTAALIINPYDIEQVALSIKKALEMDRKEKIERVKRMVKVLEEKNIYQWAREFVEQAINAANEKR